MTRGQGLYIADVAKLSLHKASNLPTGDAAVRELMAVREIVRAFLTTSKPEEVFQLALERVTPLVGALFSSMYFVERGSETMAHVASHNWPERYRPFLGQMRVRIGQGPSGRAVSERRDIEVADVFADPALSDWSEIAHELGFRAIFALPLQTADRVIGAVAFYFDTAGNFTDETRSLLHIVADQMAGTAEKAALIEELKRTNVALTQTNETLEEQNQDLLEARRVREEFLANMSHELRTPLTAVIGYVSLMEEELAGPLTADQQSTLAHVREASGRLLEMIQNILELTSLRKGEAEIATEVFEVGKILEDAAKAAKAPPEGVRLVIQPPSEGTPTMQGDRKKIVKILGALLANAFKFSAGAVTFSVTFRGDRVFFVVRDSGIGIAPAHHELIFEEFRQIDGSTTRQYGGAGLGLALARQLARLLGGEVHVHSKLGEGAAFALELPSKPSA